VQPADENNGVTLLTKKAGKDRKPASSLQVATFGSNTSTRKTYRSIVNSTTRRLYRPDLRREAVARASAVRKAQKPKPDDRPVKLRGAKARKTARGLKA
jgi:large subunit ribosomal protein L28e